jgi:ATP-dependent Clp protease ATP-binding subunit ClpA
VDWRPASSSSAEEPEHRALARSGRQGAADRKGYDEKYGAPPLRRAVEQYLEDPLAEAILRGDVEKGKPIVVTVEGEHLVFKQDQPASSIS